MVVHHLISSTASGNTMIRMYSWRLS